MSHQRPHNLLSNHNLTSSPIVYNPVRICSKTWIAVVMKASSTFSPFLADASMNSKPCCFAYCSPSWKLWSSEDVFNNQNDHKPESSHLTVRLKSRSFLFPINIITMCSFEFCFVSSSHRLRCVKVSRLDMSYINKAAQAPR